MDLKTRILEQQDGRRSRGGLSQSEIFATVNLRSRHITPTLDDMMLDLNGSKVFSKMDHGNGYHQLELSEDSRNITTFTTHVATGTK